MIPLISLENISVFGNRGNHANTIIQNINLEIYQQDILGIVGPSGAGKTTLLKCIALLNYNRTNGSYSYNSQKIIPIKDESKLLNVRKNIIFIHQTPVLFKGTVTYNIEYGFKLRKREINRDRLNDLIESFNLSHLLKRNVNLLSGGEKQRVCLLRAMALHPDVLILDEPTQNLDPANIKIIENNIKIFIEEKGTVVIVTHNLFQAQRLSTKLGILVNGRLIEYGDTNKLFTEAKNQESADFLSGRIIF